MDDRSDIDLGAHVDGQVGPRSAPERLDPEALGAAAIALTAALVRIDSVNPGLVPGAAGESAVIEHLRTRLHRTGFETRILAPPGHPDRPSLVATGPVHGTGPTVVLTGHVDTVGVEGMSRPFDATIVGDRLCGRGASDMKAGVAGMVVAAEQLVARAASGRVVLALVADEEDASLGTHEVLEALPRLDLQPDVVVVGEPTWLALTETLRGYALVEVTFTGRAAHSSQPELGVNAVTHLGRLLVAVEERADALPHPGGSLMVTVASGGTSPFVLASSARAVVERRTVPGESAGDALAEVEAVLADLSAADPTVEASARLVVAREAWRMDAEGPAATLADRLEVALARTEPPPAAAPGSAGGGPDSVGITPHSSGSARGSGEGISRERFHAPYWMEAPLWQAAGIPALVCGPAGGGLHAMDEWVDLDQLRRYAVALTAAVEDWVGARAD
jgi:acetylornithine deacetylase